MFSPGSRTEGAALVQSPRDRYGMAHSRRDKSRQLCFCPRSLGRIFVAFTNALDNFLYFTCTDPFWALPKIFSTKEHEFYINDSNSVLTSSPDVYHFQLEICRLVSQPPSM